MREKEIAQGIIADIDKSGAYEKKGVKEQISIQKTSNDEYTLYIIDSDVTQDNHKRYVHTRDGLEEYLAAQLRINDSLINRLLFEV